MLSSAAFDAQVFAKLPTVWRKLEGAAHFPAAPSSVPSTPWPASSPASAAAGASRVFGALAHVIALVAVELPCADDALARSRQRDRFSRLGRRHRSRWRRAERSHRRLCPGDV